jgi:hypothetical protein
MIATLTITERQPFTTSRGAVTVASRRADTQAAPVER